MRLVSLILKNYMKTVIFDMDGVILDDEYPYLARTKDFLESKGIAAWIKKNDNPDLIIKDLLSNNEKLESMKENTKILARPNSTKNICDALLKNN